MEILINDFTEYISIGFSVSVVVSFTSWAIMKVWNFIVEIIKMV